MRGQVARVANPGIERVWIHDEADGTITYVIPRRDDCVVGGTAEAGTEALVVDPAAIEGMLERARRLEPRLAAARLLGTAVGLRPVRPRVRLELVDEGGVPVIHDYGHGGAGLTLSWGCAEEVRRLVDGLG